MTLWAPFTTAVIAGTSVSTKDAIAMKLGYDSKDGHDQHIKAGLEGTTQRPGRSRRRRGQCLRSEEDGHRGGLEDIQQGGRKGRNGREGVVGE